MLCCRTVASLETLLPTSGCWQSMITGQCPCTEENGPRVAAPWRWRRRSCGGGTGRCRRAAGGPPAAPPPSAAAHHLPPLLLWRPPPPHRSAAGAVAGAHAGQRASVAAPLSQDFLHLSIAWLHQHCIAASAQAEAVSTTVSTHSAQFKCKSTCGELRQAFIGGAAVC